MAVKHSYFLKLDEDFLQDPEVQLFLEEKGKEAVFDYLMLLTRMRDYRVYDYMIPFSLIPIIEDDRFVTSVHVYRVYANKNTVRCVVEWSEEE